MPSSTRPVLTSLGGSLGSEGAWRVTSRPAALKYPCCCATYSATWSGLGNQSSSTVTWRAALLGAAPVEPDAEVALEPAGLEAPPHPAASSAATIRGPASLRARRRPQAMFIGDFLP